MIYGVGVDLVDVTRVERSLQRFGEKFAHRVLAPEERSDYDAAANPTAYLAKCFAVKEAFAKATGQGLRDPVTLHAVRLTREALGKPAIRVSAVLQAWLHDRGIGSHHVSLSDEHHFVIAFVVLERQ